MATINFTAGETKLIMSMIKNMKGDFPTDYDAVAVEMGYKDAQIAKTRWSQIKKKKLLGDSAGDGEKVTPKKRKSTGGADGAADDTPTPKKRGGRKPKKEEQEVDGDDMETEVKPEPDEEVVESTEKGEGDSA